MNIEIVTVQNAGDMKTGLLSEQSGRTKSIEKFSAKLQEIYSNLSKCFVRISICEKTSYLGEGESRSAY